MRRCEHDSCHPAFPPQRRVLPLPLGLKSSRGTIGPALLKICGILASWMVLLPPAASGQSAPPTAEVSIAEVPEPEETEAEVPEAEVTEADVTEAGVTEAGVTGVAVTAGEATRNDTWSTYRGGNARSGHFDADLPIDLQLLWQHQAGQPPRPAWPSPARGSLWQELAKLAPRIADDHTFHPIATQDSVLFGSSADDSVYCLDIGTGELTWRFTTDGPVRYAPTVSGDRVFFGSDDGHVYCVSLEVGNEIWRRRLAPIERQIPGNGRLISAWPVRTGVVVADGVAYVGAGLYPSQGVFAFALEEATGETLWRSGLDYTAHGYLLISQDRLILPTGRSTPIMLHRSDGRFLTQLPGSPGSYAVLTQRELFSGRGNDATLQASDIDSQESLVNVAAQHICITPQATYTLADGQLKAVNLPRLMAVVRQLKTHQVAFKKQEKRLKQLTNPPAPASDQPTSDTVDRQLAATEAATANAEEIERLLEKQRQLRKTMKLLQEQREACQLWQVATPHSAGLAAANNVLVVGGIGAIELRDCADGRLVDQLELTGSAVGMAMSESCLVVSTETGNVNCFGPITTPPRKNRSLPAAPDKSSHQQSLTSRHARDSNPWTAKVAAITHSHLRPAFGSTKGYGLVAGADDPELIEAILRGTELTIAVIDDSPSRVDVLRRRLLTEGVYGSRVAVHQVPPGRLPLADYVANLVVSTRGVTGQADHRWPTSELQRVVRPHGGIAWLSAELPSEQRGPLPGAGRWDHQYGNTRNTAANNDQFMGPELRLQWFGGPGPARMVDRHLRAPAPLAAAGRMFVSGENSIVCVDSYNGTEYWQLDVPQSQRYSMPYDCGYTAVDGERYGIAVRGAAWIVDARTGALQETIPVPRFSGIEQVNNTAEVNGVDRFNRVARQQGAIRSEDAHWGYLAMQGEQLIGSVQKPTASRTLPSREQISLDYNNDRPMVTSDGIFVIDLNDKKVRWQHESTVLNPTITVTRDRLYFVGSLEPTLATHPTGRIPLEGLLGPGADLVALDLDSGEVVWRRSLERHLSVCRNILYLQAADGLLVLSGSFTRDDDSIYRVAILDANSGATQWVAEHSKGKRGAFTHGEQVHHPVILGSRLVCEPAIYDLRSGQRIVPSGEASDWRLTRPAHSCGTMSGAGDCLLFRSGNPTVMSLGPEFHGRDRFRSISPSRPGCWINIIPADGMVLIPEASASCVCHYSLQTSMAFQPVAMTGKPKTP